MTLVFACICIFIALVGSVWLAYQIGDHRGYLRACEQLKNFWRKP